MNALLTPSEIAAMQVHSADLMAELVKKDREEKRRGPWNHSDEGRKRRKVRRAAIRAKMAWLEG